MAGTLIFIKNVSIFVYDMKYLAIFFILSGSCIFGCCSANKSQQEGSPNKENLSDTSVQRTVQRYNVSTISAIIDSVTIIDTAQYRLHVRPISADSEGGESILLGQSLELLPHYIYNDRSAIDWSVEINKKLRSIRDIHPGSPIKGKVMLDQHQHWVLVDVDR